MAKKQTRRGVSLPEAMHRAATRYAEALGIPLSQLACEALRMRGVKVGTEHRPIEDAERAIEGRRLALEDRRAAIAERMRQRAIGDQRAQEAIREAERSGV